MKFTLENLDETSKYFHDILFNQKDGEIGRKFLLNRDIGELKDFESYEIGYCPPDFPYPSAQSLYLDNRLWWMRGRLIVTIRDQHNRIISFAGRVIDENKSKLQEDLFSKINTPLLSYLNNDTKKLQSMIDEWSDKKWVNEFYAKKEYLFGLNLAKKHIFDMKYAIIVEGYMDAIVLWMNGFPNVVALCGVAMSDVHLALLRRYANHIVFCLDSDVGGEKAVERVEKLIKEQYNDLSYYKVLLPKGLDPEDTVKKDKKIFLNGLVEASKRRDEKRKVDLNDSIMRQILKFK